jgi:hypothetical protein
MSGLTRFISTQWKRLILWMLPVALLAIVVMLHLVARIEAERAAAVAVLLATPTPTATATATATPWPGPGKKVTPTATLPPTVMATDVLAESGFPPGFTPTPRPTREPVFITLPYVFSFPGRRVDVPVINQIYYPEPFFPPGTNNACGPVALYAALQALGANIDYGRLRDVAVYNGFTDYGISKSGLINTAVTLNHELGDRYVIEHGNNYGTQDIIKSIRAGGVVIVLIRVKKENGAFRVTADQYNSIGHFLIVEGINLRTQTIRLAGSTLGMDKVPLQDFIQSWASNPQAVVSPHPSLGWRGYFQNENAANWALIIKGRR